MTEALRSPYPYFGSKAARAADVWERLGHVPNYIEPFFGGGAVLLARPHPPDFELVNDVDGMIVNFWRATQADAPAVAKYADNPAFESDLHARHAWLVGRKDSLREKLEGDPTYYDARIAGWWVWGMALWIGSGFCSGRGPWHVLDGRLVRAGVADGLGVERKRPHLAGLQGVKRQRPDVIDLRGVRRQLPTGLAAYFAELQARFRQVRVTCGDWTRVVTPVLLNTKTPCGVFLDPPYTSVGRRANLYNTDDGALHVAVREWALANGGNPDYRIAYCGYDDGFEFPDGWEKLKWKANGGYANQGASRRENRHRETVWFSPHCLKPHRQLALFEEAQP